MTLHLEGKLTEGLPHLQGFVSLLFPLNVALGLVSPHCWRHMTCVKVAGRALNVGLCSHRHSSSFHRAACVVEEEFYLAAWEKVRRISTNSSSSLPADQRHNRP